MDKSGKFLLPSPKFLKLDKTPAPTPHFLSPQGMLLPKEQQPPPMYGPRGSTIPPKYLDRQTHPTAPSQPERSQKFYCGSCEAEFHTSTDFKVHKNEHVQCEIGECQFRGHPAFMDTHIVQEHSTGLYEQVKKMSTPEEIAEWREQRRKNYPTVAVVLQKQKAREQRMLRGEKLEARKSRFGLPGDRRQIRTVKQGETVEKEGSGKDFKRQNRKRNRAGKLVGAKEEKKVEEVKVEPVKQEESVGPVVCGGVKMFAGTGGMEGYRKAKKVESHALSGLLGMYGSDSESEEENSEDEKEPVAKDETKTENLPKSVPEEHMDDVIMAEAPSTETTEGTELPSEASFSETADKVEGRLPEPRVLETTAKCEAVPQQKSKGSFPDATDKIGVTPGNMIEPQVAETTAESEEVPDQTAGTSSTEPRRKIEKFSEGISEACFEGTTDKNGEVSETPVPDESSAIDDFADQPSTSERKSNKSSQTSHAEDKEPAEEVPPEDSDDDAPEEAPIAKSSNIPEKPQPSAPPRKITKPLPKRKIRKSGLDYSKLRTGRQHTLLEKLLEPDIRHERNVILQCVRFVVANNFFGIGSPPSQSQS